MFDFINNEKLKKQLSFLVEIDKMKNELRRTLIIDGTRRENDAEHSWHLAMYALILSEYAPSEIDVNKTIKLGVVHDLVEIYAGDTFAYDVKGNCDKEQREKEAADKLFGMLDEEQGREIRSLWEEFDAKETPESKFANVCDRLQPLIHNYYTDGHTWRNGNVSVSQVYDRMRIIETQSPELWNIVEGIIQFGIDKGYLREE